MYPCSPDTAVLHNTTPCSFISSSLRCARPCLEWAELALPNVSCQDVPASDAKLTGNIFGLGVKDWQEVDNFKG